MALFNPSLKTVADARGEIADSAGSSANTDMLVRAGRSLDAAFEYFNGRANWEFLLTESSPVNVFGPGTVTGVSASAGETSAAMPVGHGLKIDDVFQMGGIIFGTRLTATAAGSVGFNSIIASSIGAGVQVLTATAIRDFYDLPSDWKSVYSVRMYATRNTLRPVRRRTYDRSIGDEFIVSIPQWYDIYGIGAKGKLRLLPAPAASDVLGYRYYRRMTVSTATAATLDIPQDYEPYLIAWAKWHFLVDKSEGRGDQANIWLSLANEGIKTMIADQTRIPDEDLVMVPGHYSYTFERPNSTSNIDWNY